MNHSTPGLPVHHQLPEITCSQTDGETMEIVTEFILLGSKKITADGDTAMKLKDTCSLEEKLRQT